MNGPNKEKDKGQMTRRLAQDTLDIRTRDPLNRKQNRILERLGPGKTRLAKRFGHRKVAFHINVAESTCSCAGSQSSEIYLSPKYSVELSITIRFRTRTRSKSVSPICFLQLYYGESEGWVGHFWIDRLNSAHFVRCSLQQKGPTREHSTKRP